MWGERWVGQSRGGRGRRHGLHGILTGGQSGHLGPGQVLAAEPRAGGDPGRRLSLQWDGKPWGSGSEQHAAVMT